MPPPPFHCHCVLKVSYSRRSIRRTFDFLSPMLSGTTHHHPSRQFNLGYSPVVKVPKTLGEVGKVSKPRPFYFSHLFLLLFLASSMADSFLYTYHICMDGCIYVHLPSVFKSSSRLSRANWITEFAHRARCLMSDKLFLVCHVPGNSVAYS